MRSANYLFFVIFYTLVLSQAKGQDSTMLSRITKPEEYDSIANDYSVKKNYQSAAIVYAKAFTAFQDPLYAYNAAGMWALAGNRDAAFEQLNKVRALSNTSQLYDYVVGDSTFMALHNDSRWQKLCSELLSSKRQATHVSYDKDHLMYSVGKSLFDSLKQVIDSFFVTMNHSYTQNSYWLSSDFKEFVYPYRYLANAAQYNNKYNALHPFVMNIFTDSIYHDFLIKIAYIGPADSINYTVGGIYYVAIVKDSSGAYKLKHPRDYITRGWKKYQVDNINFIVNKKRKFNLTEAKRMNDYNGYLARYFHSSVLHFKYYSCGHYADLLQPQGQDSYFITGNYDTITGGMGEPYSKCIYSANNSEYYPHELVHLYLSTFIDYAKGTVFIIDEGIATFLGGSGNYDLSFHLRNVSHYIRDHHIHSINTLADIDTPINGNTDVVYVIGGLMAKLVDQKLGYKGLIEFEGIKESDVYAFIGKLYQIKESEVDSFLIAELKKYE